MIAIASKQFVGDNQADMIAFGNAKGGEKVRLGDGTVEVLTKDGWQVVDSGDYVQYDWYGNYQVSDEQGSVIDNDGDGD